MYFMKNMNLLGTYHRRRRTEAPHYEPGKSTKHVVEKPDGRKNQKYPCLYLCP
jgi:predicted cupin superfamily sugar epimerase